VLFATAELAPLVRVGGLAAAAAGLVAELRRQHVDVEVVLPDYASVPLAGERIEVLDVPDWVGPATARIGIADGIGAITLVSVPGIARPHPYVQPNGHGWPDNDRRFIGFSAAIAALVERRVPDVLHLNDWHTAATLGFLPTRPPTVLTVHTLGYQGQCDIGWLKVFSAGPDAFEMWGDCNPLAGAIRLADRVIAVSPNYANEITTSTFGFGLDALLRGRGDDLVGVLNGIDDEMWDPATDSHLASPFSAKDMAPRSANRAALLERFGRPAWGGPVVTVVTRLVDQKGVDLVAALAPYLARLNATMLVLGDGDDALAEMMTTAAEAHPTHVGFVRGYDESLAHLMFGGADVFLMPSRFEPCGLAQMQAMRYGALPLVTAVGGLVDTVIDVDADSAHGTGVVAERPEPLDVLDGLHRIARAWSQVRRRAAMQRRGMTVDWSWRAPATRHIDIYEQLISAGHDG
jgi:starch synthase